MWSDAVKKGLIGKNENMVWANEKLSKFTYQELLNIKEDLVRRLYLDWRRWLRIVTKTIGFGEFGLLCKAAFGLNKNFLTLANYLWGPKKTIAKLKI